MEVNPRETVVGVVAEVAAVRETLEVEGLLDSFVLVVD